MNVLAATRDAASSGVYVLWGVIVILGSFAWWTRFPSVSWAPREDRRRQRLRWGGSIALAVVGASALLAAALV